MTITSKNLTKEAPTSPRHRIHNYAILSRMADKGRATLNGTAGEYHFACPLDQMLFEFKGVKDADVKEQLASGASDEQIAAWIDGHGTPKTDAEKKAWSDAVEAARPYDDPERRDWFVGECAKSGINPQSSTLFDFLEADDAISFKK